MGKLYMVREGGDPLAAFKRDIRNFTWNVTDFTFDEGSGDGEVVVRRISRKFSEPYALLFSRFLEGAFTAFGYGCVQRDVAKGALQLRLSREPWAAEAQERPDRREPERDAPAEDRTRRLPA